MTKIIIQEQDFDLNWKDALEFNNLPQGADPTDELYDFVGNASQKKANATQGENQYAFYSYVKNNENNERQDYPDGFSTAQRPCLGKFTHSTYKIDRFGAIFQADWALYRIQGETQAFIKNYDSDEGKSIAPDDLGKVFKGEEFTQAMDDFLKAYKQKMGELKQALKDPANRNDRTDGQLGQLAAAVSDNDLLKVFQILYKPEFIKKNLETIKQAIRLHIYLEAGLALAKGNKDYKVNNPHKTKSAIEGTKKPFCGVSKHSGDKQADQVLNKLTQDKVMNELVPLLSNYWALYNTDQTSDENDGDGDGVSDTADNDGSATSSQPEDPVTAAVHASPSGPTPTRESDEGGLRGPGSGDGAATPTDDADDSTSGNPDTGATSASDGVHPEPAVPNTNETSPVIEACVTEDPTLDDINTLLEAFIRSNRPENQNNDNTPVDKVQTKPSTDKILDQDGKSLKIDGKTYKYTPGDIAELRALLILLLQQRQPQVILHNTDLDTRSVMNYAYTLFAKRNETGFIDFPKSRTKIGDALGQNAELMASIEGLKAITNPNDVQSIIITGYASAHGESVIDNGKTVLVTDSNIAKYVDPETHTLKSGYKWAKDSVPTKVSLGSGKFIDNPRYAKERAETLKQFLITQGVSQAIVDKVKIESKGGAFKPTATLLYTIKSAVNVSFSMSADDITNISGDEKRKVADFMSATLNPYFATIASERQDEYQDQDEIDTKAQTALQEAAKVMLALLNPTTFAPATRDKVATKIHTEMQKNASSVCGARLLARVLETQPEFAHLSFAQEAKDKKAAAEATVARSGIFVAVSAATPKAKIEADKIIPSAKISFESGSATLTTESQESMKDLARFLNQHSEIKKINIGGHTDNTGDDAKNLTLSTQRAEAVLRFLVQQGVAINRLTATGYGEARPIDSNHLANGRANNRRVEFVIVAESQPTLPVPAATLPSDTRAVLDTVTKTVGAVTGTSSASAEAQQPTAATLSFKIKIATFKVTETEPVFQFNGDETQITNVHVVFGTKKIPLAFTSKDKKIEVQGLVKYSKAVAKYLQNSDASLDENTAKSKAKMNYPIEITLKDGSVIKLTAKGE